MVMGSSPVVLFVVDVNAVYVVLSFDVFYWCSEALCVEQKVQDENVS